jgi:hypothetical protein
MFKKLNGDSNAYHKKLAKFGFNYLTGLLACTMTSG